MRTYCAMLALLLSASATLAQQPAPSSNPITPAAHTQADSVAALRHYFQHKRQVGALVTVGLLAAPVSAGVAASRETDPLGRGLGYMFGVPLGAALPFGSWLYHRQYNRRQEERAVQALQAGTLPVKLQRRLKPAYFQP
ncbi:hypothetical protein [Hymenobacter pini]|uniref:hypothetical protein n=1 Tax=Hymenobacter pini TaxID=2880879 RepID=UPI001CF2E759|nr:hypothetical protein [Hymenobacter pini]MCA8830854.1 hypothetical protein [Hymenobacter pini]